MYSDASYNAAMLNTQPGSSSVDISSTVIATAGAHKGPITSPQGQRPNAQSSSSNSIMADFENHDTPRGANNNKHPLTDSEIIAKAMAANIYQIEDYDGKTPVNLWINKFRHYIDETGYNPLLIMSQKLKDQAQDWLIEMDFTNSDTFDDMMDALRERFTRTKIQKAQDKAELMAEHQRPDETPCEWLDRASKGARGLNIDPTELVYLIVNGIRPEKEHDLLLLSLGDKVDHMTIKDLRKQHMFRHKEKIKTHSYDNDEQYTHPRNQQYSSNINTYDKDSSISRTMRPRWNLGPQDLSSISRSIEPRVKKARVVESGYDNSLSKESQYPQSGGNPHPRDAHYWHSTGMPPKLE